MAWRRIGAGAGAAVQARIWLGSGLAGATSASARGEAGSWPGLAGSSFSALDGARWLRSGGQRGLDPGVAAPDGGGYVGGCGLATGNAAVAMVDGPCTRRLIEAIGTDLGEDLLAAAAEAGDGGTIRCRSFVEGIAVEKF